MAKRILSGVQPSGKLHLGNYFGMMRPALLLQEQCDAFLFIANYHALTTVADAARLREATLDVALDFLACGLDPARPCDHPCPGAIGPKRGTGVCAVRPGQAAGGVDRITDPRRGTPRRSRTLKGHHARY